VCSAAPCAPDPNAYKVYLARGGVLPVASITVRPDFSFPVGDLAVVKLAQPVNGIPPSEIDTTQAPPFGTPGVIVGYGRTGGTNFDYGIARYGAVTTGACPPLVSPTTSVCWTFEAPIGPPGVDSNTCNGDSGGPLFVDFGAGPRIAGVTSGGTSTNCLAPDQSYDANVYTYRNWTLATGGADLDAPVCGALPQVGDAAAAVADFAGTVTAAAPDGRHSVDVPAGATLLRVGMNAVDDGSNFDLYVKHGAPPTPTSFDCARTGSTQFGVCDLGAPAAGTWHVLVRRVGGSGAYQLATTTFGASALTVALSSTVGRVAPGQPFPFTLSIENQTGGTQGFAMLAVVVPPDGATLPLIPARGMSLADGATFAPTLAIELPPDAMLGNWNVGAVVWQPGAGLIGRAMLGFEVR
jgi:hypothetical protein